VALHLVASRVVFNSIELVSHLSFMFSEHVGDVFKLSLHELCRMEHRGMLVYLVFAL
jgi:hypothetical protein